SISENRATTDNESRSFHAMRHFDAYRHKSWGVEACANSIVVMKVREIDLIAIGGNFARIIKNSHIQKLGGGPAVFCSHQQTIPVTEAVIHKTAKIVSFAKPGK